HHSVEVGSFVVGWCPPKARVEDHETAHVVAAVDYDSMFAPLWTGCSGRFAPRNDEHDNAKAHYDKHVRIQHEWSMEVIPDVAAYVASATRALDAVENVFEFW